MAAAYAICAKARAAIRIVAVSQNAVTARVRAFVAIAEERETQDHNWPKTFGTGQLTSQQSQDGAGDERVVVVLFYSSLYSSFSQSLQKTK